jgi:hypothetical protein
MKIEFKRPMVPNFIRTNKGLFDISELNREELERLKIEYSNALEDNWRKRLNDQGKEVPMKDEK